MALKKDRPHRGPTDTDAVLKKLKNVFFSDLVVERPARLGGES
jgi:hypothetical protein